MQANGQTQQGKKVRYAVIGLGWIAQEVVLPGFQNADNAELAALVTDDAEKAKQLGQHYGVAHTYNYGQFSDMLRSGVVDAIYIATPNSEHLRFALPAMQAGVHVLCEKPLAATASECEQMIAAATEHRVKLMTAYRLHLEAANLRAVEIIRSGEIGEARIFHSAFSQQVAEGNVRLKKKLGGGPLLDMGVYAINAARYLFGAEPEQVTAFRGTTGEPRFSEVEEMVAATLRFPGDRLASLTCSFGAAPADSYQVLGTKGSLLLKPAYSYEDKKTLTITTQDKPREEQFPVQDQFGAQLLYFARCIQEDQEPDPGGAEGLADVRIAEAIYQSIEQGKAVPLEPFTVPSRPDKQQEVSLPAVKKGKLVNAESPAGKQ